MRLRQLGLVVAGGVVGAALRHLAAQNPSDIPWEVLAINLIGAAVAGWLVGRIRLHSHPARWLIPFAVVGAAGALTTFSGLVVDTLLLADAGRWAAAGIYSAASVVSGPIVAGVGLWLGGRS